MPTGCEPAKSPPSPSPSADQGKLAFGPALPLGTGVLAEQQFKALLCKRRWISVQSIVDPHAHPSQHAWTAVGLKLCSHLTLSPHIRASARQCLGFLPLRTQAHLLCELAQRSLEHLWWRHGAIIIWNTLAALHDGDLRRQVAVDASVVTLSHNFVAMHFSCAACTQWAQPC